MRVLWQWSMQGVQRNGCSQIPQALCWRASILLYYSTEIPCFLQRSWSL